MAFRFFKRIKIAPGVSINLSKSGGSVSFGPRGAKITLGPKGIRRTGGIPGTGVYYTETSSMRGTSKKNSGVLGCSFVLILLLVLTVLGFMCQSRNEPLSKTYPGNSLQYKPQPQKILPKDRFHKTQTSLSQSYDIKT